MSHKSLAIFALLFFAQPTIGGQEPIPTAGIAAEQPVATFQARRAALLKELSDGVVVIVGARDDEVSEFERFRQDNDFFYLTGIEAPNAALLLIPSALDPEGKPHCVAFLPPRSPFAERWTGPTEGPGPETAAKYGMDEVVPTDQLYLRILQALSPDPVGVESKPNRRGATKLYTHLARGSNAENTRTGRFAETLRRIAPRATIENIAPTTARLRLIKSDPELTLIRRAIAITTEAHRDAAKAIHPGAIEFEVQGALEYAFTRNGAERRGFFSIVGSGPNSCIPHYSANRRTIESADLVVVDIGAEYRYYTADLTRTYPASGKFSSRQREVYQLVLDAQLAAEKAFVVGKTTIRDLQAAATTTMQASPLRDAEGNSLERYFVHGLGHWMGLEVHDVGDYSDPIPAGAVFTIEPGIYIPAESLGVRIEDDYLATSDGLVKLSADLPSAPADVEAMMEKAAEASAAGVR
jgi:Xaa-Pro aminopeptidase